MSRHDLSVFLENMHRLKIDPDTNWGEITDGLITNPEWCEYKTRDPHWEIGDLQFALEMIAMTIYNPEGYESMVAVVRKIHAMEESA